MPISSRLFFWKKDKQAGRHRAWIFGLVLGFGLLGLLASFVLTLDKFKLLDNPNASLSCSVNLVINCSTVMQTAQASVFGFPNSLLGVALFPVVIFIAVLGLANVKLPRQLLGIINIGFALGAVFAYWLFFQSVFVIQVLCPWCLLVTTSTTVILASMFHYNLDQDTFFFSKKAKKRAAVFIEKDYLKLLTIVWLAFLSLLVFVKFGDSLFL